MRVLVAGLGNIFEGDDAFGVEVAQRLSSMDWPTWRSGLDLEVRDFGIRGVHLAYQLLDGYDLVVIADAVSRGATPGTLYEMEHGADPTAAETAGADQGTVPGPLMDAHDLGPDGVLALVPRLGGELGRVVVIGCEPADLTPGMGLSPAVASSVDTAANLVIATIGTVLAATSDLASGAAAVETAADHRDSQASLREVG